MKKNRLLVIFVMLSLALTACSAASATPENSESNWFNPTPPEDIKLASGQLQFFEFSAVW